MDFLFKYNQEKSEKNSDGNSTCGLKLFYDGTTIIYNSIFEFNYQRYGNKKHVTFEHTLGVDTNTGDVTVKYDIINDGLTNERMFKTTTKTKKNDFSMLHDLIENGYIHGEKRKGYWGVKYNRAIENISSIILNLLRIKFNSDFLINKNHQTNSNLYVLIVDFHLDMKGIKGHNGVYDDIQTEYPKKKWLIKNDNKFLPAILDSYGIKSKYLIGELNKKYDRKIQISSLNYICKLFGENYIDYLKQINWDKHCYDSVPNKKLHTLKNDSEKNHMVLTINKWETESIKTDSLIYSLNKLFTIREQLEQKGIDLKYTSKNDTDFDNLFENWIGIKRHFSRGYKLKYNLPEDFIKTIEEDIIINGEVFKPKLILNEDDFRVEGHKMKNCMSKQFPHGAIYIFVAMQFNRKRINLQYRKGNLVQSYGKANTPVNNIFNEASLILTNRFKHHSTIEWKKEKYNIITD